jgi:flagellum-specific peptidoglycan hydrolase FlgJ
MGTYNENAAYFERMFPYAKRASELTDLPISAILAQWAHESSFGTSAVANNATNHGGVKWVKNSIASGKYGAYASYSSLDQFVEDYVRVIKNGYYPHVMAAVSPEDTIKAFNIASKPGGPKYAEDQIYSPKVLNIFDLYGLRGYDTYGGGDPGAAPAAPTTLSLPNLVDTFKAQAGEMSPDDLKKYAGIGLAAAVLILLITD